MAEGPRLTDAETLVLQKSGELWNLICDAIGKDAPECDSSEMATHIHAIQRAFLANATMRAYPDRFRPFGELPIWTKEELMSEEIIREYYEHDAGCPANDFHEKNDRGLKTCKDCAGVFDSETGKGVAVTDKRFDANWVDPNA